jgi:DNA replication and repair protein RecF
MGQDDLLVASVELRDFRTYSRAEASLGNGLTVLHGANGAGKSNLLEAIYYGCTARPLRTRNERELVRFGATATRVVVRVSAAGRSHELTVGFEPGGAKRMTADGAPVERLLDVQERPLLSVFMPDRLELVKGAPGTRRAHLDQLVSALSPSRGADRREYSRVLLQRNALLAGIRAGRASRATLSSWDRELALRAIALRENRQEAASLIAAHFSSRASQLGLSGEAVLEYRPRSRAETADEFIAELSERLSSDLERGFSGHGPHRDELAFRRDGRELRSYGSQGEQRLALLALLLAERDVLCQRRRRMPLLLLDDVMSELDADRRELLAAELSSAGQSVIATTDLGHVPGATRASVTRLRVSPGVLLQEALAA